jgi:hypothetical protein
MICLYNIIMLFSILIMSVGYISCKLGDWLKRKFLEYLDPCENKQYMVYDKKNNRFITWVGKGNMPKQPSRIHEFCEEAYKKTGGATKELKRVYRAYLNSQRGGKDVQ